MSGFQTIADIAAMQRTSRGRRRPPRMRLAPFKVPLSLAIGATPISAAALAVADGAEFAHPDAGVAIDRSRR